MLETAKAFSALSEEFVECLLRDHPVWATEAGIHDYDHRLPRDTPEGFAERAAWLRGLEQRLVAAVPWNELPIEGRVEYGLLRARIAGMRADLEEIRLQARNPSRFPDTALRAVHLLLHHGTTPLEERKEAILARMMGLPEYFAGARGNLETVPARMVELASVLSGAGIASMEAATQHLIRHFPAEAERIEHAGSLARRGFAQYQEFLRQELRPRAGGSVAIGERWMSHKLEREHLLPLDCAALEALGRERVTRAQDQLAAEAKRLDPARPWQAQIAEARRRHPEPQRLIEAYAAECRRAEEFLAHKRLAPQPENRLEIAETPGYLRTTIPLAGYQPPPAFDAEHPGYLLVTPIDADLEPAEREGRAAAHHDAAVTLRAIGLGRPGRHTQSARAIRAASRLRRIAESPLFHDGWGLYAEELMWEEGFFRDPVTRLEQLRHQLEAACEATIDAALHAGHMSLEQAGPWLAETAAIDPPAATARVEARALHPGRPMSALVGREMILELREEARRRLGARFRLVDFHAALLAGGALPPTLVREEIWGRLGA